MRRQSGPVEALVEASLAYNCPRQGDWFDEEGHLVCGTCGERKTADKVLPGVSELEIEGHVTRVGVACRCIREQTERERELDRKKEHRELVEKILREGMADNAYRSMVFERDDAPDSENSRSVHAYVDAWQEVRKNNLGMLLHGGVGTGKTFYACCVANALAEQELGVLVATTPELISRMTGFSGAREETVAHIQRVSLLVLDDFGAERNTEFSVEQMFSILDARYRSGKPLIVTTNLSEREMNTMQDPRYQRICDRILEMCPIRLRVGGKSRRQSGYNARRDLAREVLQRALKEREEKERAAKQNQANPSQTEPV